VRRCTPTCAVTFRNVRRKSNFAHVGIQYSYVQIYMYVYACMYKGVLSKFKHWNMIGCNMTPPPLPRYLLPTPPVLSPSSIPPPSSHCAFIPTWKNSTRISECHVILFTFFELRRLKLLNLKLRYVGSVCILLVSFKRSICYRRRIHGNAKCSILAILARNKGFLKMLIPHIFFEIKPIDS